MKELMIGDCVFVKSKNKTGVVHEIYARSAHVWCGETYGSVYSDRYDYDDIEPIPLTAEILEKNGWEHAYEKNTLGELHKWHKEVRFQQFTVWKNKGRFELGNLGNHPFRFVHELQHALRLCGLDILANNFKILDDYERS